ncbi:protein-L-isoaspartate(D-aspartate) O-methyltransferase [Nitrospirillum sp. BR 11163]|uniref:protein-L-isoaspartate(D-aspartate) O-methyltransferase n=1 Tax=Nitrospirillum sp. BR 11163 TaxID=3104323 RepID=UPI002AFEF8AF|nr:protein-L-isoaspartate(D-aspartate) O-methyltransferase [Nitrospirillum sp. BR 11163]MEA1675365.1 protein-L-isoaspartate(D-aspartate) O-methyltransferase [Nitrospirillum sp. BR 11163]
MAWFGKPGADTSRMVVDLTARQDEREALVAAIARRMRLERPPGLPSLSPRVAAALLATPRELFAPADQAPHAYHDQVLPLAAGQTLSQPSLVALMTELLDIRSGDRVLEIGVGSGYQTALLARLGAKVHGLEVIADLAQAAERRLAALGLKNVTLRVGDGHGGWPDAAPFDAILAACAAPRVPPALVDQLRPGGRLLLPVGPADGAQQLCLVEKGRDNQVSERPLLAVAFVPMVTK